MKPILQWTEDWEIGIDIPKESDISKQVLDLFVEFWSDAEIEEKPKSTLNRYRADLIIIGVRYKLSYILSLFLNLKLNENGTTS